MPTDFGSKEITVSNWQEADERTEDWRGITAIARTKEEWIGFFSSPKLNPTVPVEIAKLLEVARGAMIYSWYFHSLAALGAEQCLRLLDTGTRIRCERAGIPTRFKRRNGEEVDTSFNNNLGALMTHGIVSRNDEARWESIRRLRNSSSHPKQQLGIDPGQAQNILSLAVDLLNDLFR